MRRSPRPRSTCSGCPLWASRDWTRAPSLADLVDAAAPPPRHPRRRAASAVLHPACALGRLTPRIDDAAFSSPGAPVPVRLRSSCAEGATLPPPNDAPLPSSRTRRATSRGRATRRGARAVIWASAIAVATAALRLSTPSRPSGDAHERVALSPRALAQPLALGADDGRRLAVELGLAGACARPARRARTPSTRTRAGCRGCARG